MAEHPAGHLVLKWLIQHDGALAQSGREGTAHSEWKDLSAAPPTADICFLHPVERFGRILVDTVGTEQLKSWARVNRGAIVLCRSVTRNLQAGGNSASVFTSVI